MCDVGLFIYMAAAAGSHLQPPFRQKKVLKLTMIRSSKVVLRSSFCNLKMVCSLTWKKRTLRRSIVCVCVYWRTVNLRTGCYYSDWTHSSSFVAASDLKVDLTCVFIGNSRACKLLKCTLNFCQELNFSYALYSHNVQLYTWHSI